MKDRIAIKVSQDRFKKEKVLIDHFDDNIEIVGYYRCNGYDQPITVGDIKNYYPKDNWDISMSSAVKEYKYLQENSTY